METFVGRSWRRFSLAPQRLEREPQQSSYLPRLCPPAAFMSANFTVSVAMSSTDFGRLRRALFTEDGHENFAVVLCGLSATPGERRLLVREIWPAPESAYTERLTYHLEIAPTFLNAIVDRCLATGLHQSSCTPIR